MNADIVELNLSVSIYDMTVSMWIFAVLLALTKISDCGLGALLNHFDGREALQIGVGMISRGEVAKATNK